jgi:hypothetical protein
MSSLFYICQHNGIFLKFQRTESETLTQKKWKLIEESSRCLKKKMKTRRRIYC